jgi:hypothetical protein
MQRKLMAIATFDVLKKPTNITLTANDYLTKQTGQRQIEQRFNKREYTSQAGKQLLQMIIHKGHQEPTEGVTPHRTWAQSMVVKGTKSLSDQAEGFVRMMRACNISDPRVVTLDDLLRYLWLARATCKYQTLAEYAKSIRLVAERIGLGWATEGFVPMLTRGLRLQAEPPIQAPPITREIFHAMQPQLDENHQMATTIAILGGTRMDEIYNLEEKMISRVQISDVMQHLRQFYPQFCFVALQTKQESKTGKSDPYALRFIDIILLSAQQWQKLSKIMKDAKSHFKEKLFGGRQQLITALKQQQMTEHSFKRSVSDMLSVFIRDGLLPETCLPMILKHETKTEVVKSTTAGYMTDFGKLNILQSKMIFDAAVHIRRHVFQDM